MASQRDLFFADSGPWLLRTVCALRVRVALLKAIQSLLEKSGRVQRDRPTTNRKQTDTDKHGADTRTKHNTNHQMLHAPAPYGSGGGNWHAA